MGPYDSPAAGLDYSFGRAGHYDLLVTNSADQPIMVVEVKARSRIDRSLRDQMRQYLHATKLPVKYVMMADREYIQICSWNGKEFTEPCIELPTMNILEYYDPEIGHKKVFEHYLTRLVESWLRDVAYHWRSERPPYMESLKQIGLAQSIANGFTRIEPSTGP